MPAQIHKKPVMKMNEYKNDIQIILNYTYIHLIYVYVCVYIYYEGLIYIYILNKLAFNVF